MGLAFTFGFYGLVKSRVGSRYPALITLTGETAMITPLALVAVALLGAQGQITLASEGTGHFLLLLSSGVITAVPLLLFGAAAARLPLSTVGMLQYIAPIGQFILAVLVFHEEMPPERWVGFGLVWLAVVLLVLDATTGQNGLTQARIFAEVVDVTGIVLTKLDGSAKGGIVVQVQRELGVPVKLVGLGEGVDDLAPFDVEWFVDGLLGTDDDAVDQPGRQPAGR